MIIPDILLFKKNTGFVSAPSLSLRVSQSCVPRWHSPQLVSSVHFQQFPSVLSATSQSPARCWIPSPLPYKSPKNAGGKNVIPWFLYSQIHKISHRNIFFYLYSSGPRGRLCEVVNQVRLGWLDIWICKSPAMESLEALNSVLTIGDHLDKREGKEF